MIKVKFYFSVKNGATPQSGEAAFWDGDIMWITPADYTTQQCYISESRRNITEEGLNSCGTNLVPIGSVVVSNRAPIGLIGIAANPLCTSQGCKSLVKKKENINEKYVYYFLATQEAALNSLGRGTTFFELSSFDLANFRIPMPSLEKQTAIAAYLDRRTAEIDALLADLQSQAEMLDRYKRELIADAVTKGLDKSAAMKDSGVDWIGEIPAAWESLPLYAVAKENNVKNEGMACDNLLSLSYGRIIPKDIDTNFGLLPASFEGYQIVQPGYTVLRLTDLQNDKRSLRTGYVTETGIITSAYLGLIPGERLDSRYFTYLLHAYDLLKIYYGLGSGLRQSLKFSDMKRLPVMIPPMPEQQRIAAFIDKKTAKIEGLIADITAQIEKLKQYRQIVIHDAVTGKIKVTEG
jgi:restriction endonuclease S subunit